MPCCGLRKRKSKDFHQTLVLLRHSERKDYVDVSYKTSDEGLAWPHDAPLTERGVRLAKEEAMELSQLHEEVRFSAVVSSPYLRCLETAAELIKVLKLPLIVDQELGEIWDRDMPQDPKPWRSPEELAGLLQKMNIEKVLNPELPTGGIKPFGKAPVYPETLEAAHQRYIVRMETYILQSAHVNSNFILVTHADALAGVLRMFERGQADVSKIDFCARIIARRTVEEAPPLNRISPSGKGFTASSSLSSLQFFNLHFANSQVTQTSVNPFAYHWNLDWKGIDVEVYKHEGLEKYYERKHLENCEETEAKHCERRVSFCSTDDALGRVLSMQSARPSPPSDEATPSPPCDEVVQFDISELDDDTNDQYEPSGFEMQNRGIRKAPDVTAQC